MSIASAFLYLILQCLLGLVILLQFNWYSVAIGTTSLIWVAIYPFMKRFTYWPQIFLGMLTNELRRMLLIRAQLDEPGARAPDPRTDYRAYKAASRASRYTVRELARALAGAAELDVKLKTSAPPLETLTAYVGGLIASS